jgi:pilus assembly protein CpaE
MLIRVENVPAAEPEEAVLVGGPPGQASLEVEVEVEGADDMFDHSEGGSRAGKVVIVFNPKGGVGKTTISINTGAALQILKGQKVLLVDCDTITGHIAPSLGLQRARTLAQAWRDDAARTGAYESVSQIASVHSSGISVLILAESPLHTEALEPKRVARAIIAARYAYDFVILDMHPDYGPLNQALFERADTILVPVTPDVPCIRAAVQFREVADELGIRDRLALVINRANSGVAASDVERVVAVPAIAHVRSAGMMFVRAADEGKTAVERYPEAKVVRDITALAERLVSGTGSHNRRPGFPSRSRISRSFKGLVNRLTAAVS